MWSCHGGIFQGGLWFLPHVLMMALFLTAIFLVFRHFSPKRCEVNNSLSLLEESYIRGEITKEEYLEKKEILSGNK